MYLEKKVNMKSLLNIIYALNLPSSLFFSAFDFVHVVRMRTEFCRHSDFTFLFQYAVKVILETFIPKANFENLLLWLSVVQIMN